LRSLPPDARQSEPHDLGFFYRWRFLVGFWKWLYFTRGQNAKLDRGEYLVRALGHCGECHTPRNFLGGPKKERFLAGDKDVAPNLTPTRLGKKGDGELKEFLRTAMTPDGDVAAESMAEVVTNTTSQLTPQDLDALIAFLRSLPPLPEEGK
jgi:mono/diheme cytochrome c family protein